MNRATAVWGFGLQILSNHKNYSQATKGLSWSALPFFGLAAFLNSLSILTFYPTLSFSARLADVPASFIYLSIYKLSVDSHKYLQILPIPSFLDISLFPVNTTIWIKFLIYKNNTRPLILWKNQLQSIHCYPTKKNLQFCWIWCAAANCFSPIHLSTWS